MARLENPTWEVTTGMVHLTRGLQPRHRRTPHQSEGLTGADRPAHDTTDRRNAGVALEVDAALPTRESPLPLL